MITPKEARDAIDIVAVKSPGSQVCWDHEDILHEYITQQEKKDKLLELYKKSHEYIIVAFLGVKDLYNETPHYVVCQSDNEKFDRLTKEIKAIEEEEIE